MVLDNGINNKGRKIAITGYWTFFCNPRKWQIDKFLEQNRQDDIWQFNPWYLDDCKPGQLAVVRVGRDDRTKDQRGPYPRLQKGIFAIAEILSQPIQQSEAPDEFWLGWQESDLDRLVVRVKYIHNLLERPLLLSDLENDPVIREDHLLISGFQKVSMPLSKEAFKRILELINKEAEFAANIGMDLEPADNIENIRKLEDRFRNATPEVKEVVSKLIERGPISTMIKKLNGFRCLVCEALGQSPHSFRKMDGIPYIESHHIIPVSMQVKGSLTFSNIITVCANHHRQLHYGDTEVISDLEDALNLRIDTKIISVPKVSIRQ